MEQKRAELVSLRILLSILFKRKIQIIVLFAGALITISIGLMLRKTVYEATCVVMVKQGRDNIMNAPRVNENLPNVYIEQQEIINSEIKILQSRSLAQKAVKDIGPLTLYKDLRKTLANENGWLSKINNAFLNLVGGSIKNATFEDRNEALLNSALIIFLENMSVEGIKKSNLIAIHFKHEDPTLAAIAVNKLAEFYLEHHVEVHKRKNSGEFFSQQAEFLKSKIFQTEQSLIDLKKQSNITSIVDQKALLLRQHGELRFELNQALSMEAQTARRIREYKQQLASTPSTIPQRTEEEVNNQLINTLQARLVELELKERELLSKYKEDSRLVVGVREEIAVLRGRLGDQEKRLYGRSMSGINPTHQRIHEDFLKSESDLKAVQAKIITLKEQIEDYQKQLDKVNHIDVLLGRLSEELEVDRKNYRLYLSKYEESRISTAMDSEKITNVSLLEKAQPPLQPTSSNGLLIFAAGTAIALLVSVGSAIFQEYLSDHIERPEELESVMDAPVLTSIPDLKPAASLSS